MVWKFHVVGDDKVAEGAIATVVTLATQTHLGPALCKRLYLQF